MFRIRKSCYKSFAGLTLSCLFFFLSFLSPLLLFPPSPFILQALKCVDTLKISSAATPTSSSTAMAAMANLAKSVEQRAKKAVEVLVLKIKNRLEDMLAIAFAACKEKGNFNLSYFSISLYILSLFYYYYFVFVYLYFLFQLLSVIYYIRDTLFSISYFLTSYFE